MWQDSLKRDGTSSSTCVKESTNPCKSIKRNIKISLEVGLDDYAMYMKYVLSLQEYIRRDLNMFSIDTILEESIKTITIEGSLGREIEKLMLRVEVL